MYISGIGPHFINLKAHPRNLQQKSPTRWQGSSSHSCLSFDKVTLKNIIHKFFIPAFFQGYDTQPEMNIVVF